MNLFDSPLLLSKNDGLQIEQKIVKRLLDIAISAVGLLITSPLFLLIAISIKCTDPVSYTHLDILVIFYIRCVRFGSKDNPVIEHLAMLIEVIVLTVNLLLAAALKHFTILGKPVPAFFVTDVVIFVTKLNIVAVFLL